MSEGTPEAAHRVIVIGGGFAGLAVAARLAQAGLPVTVFEASRLGHGASTRNQGWLHSGAVFAVHNPPLARMCHESLQQTLAFCPQCVEPGHEGMAFVVSRPETHGTEWTEAWANAGIAYREIPRQDVLNRLPDFDAQRLIKAFLLPDRSIRPDILLEHLAAAAANAGAEIRAETPVTELRATGEQIDAVVTSAGEEVHAAFVVLAGGTESMTLLKPHLGGRTGEQSDYQRVALKAHLLAVAPSMGALPLCVIDEEQFNHLPHQTTSVFGADRWKPVADPADQSAEDAEIDWLLDRIQRFFPSFDRDRFQVTTWAGTTVQAMHVEQVQPGLAPLPTVIDHRHDRPRFTNLVSVYPGRATLWVHLAEEARKFVLDRLDLRAAHATPPPWAPQA